MTHPEFIVGEGLLKSAVGCEDNDMEMISMSISHEHIAVLRYINANGVRSLRWLSQFADELSLKR